ncbi:hypothetical protein SAMN04515648_4595, partial [Phyllobacterium sp. CL33Tsu]
NMPRKLRNDINLAGVKIIKGHVIPALIIAQPSSTHVLCIPSRNKSGEHCPRRVFSYQGLNVR